MKVIANTIVVLPHPWGYVARGRVIDVEAWDLGTYPWLKHFSPVDPVPAKAPGVEEPAAPETPGKPPKAPKSPKAPKAPVAAELTDF